MTIKGATQLGLVSLLAVMVCSMSACQSKVMPTIEADKLALGQKLYFDAALSEPAGQSCASCHLSTAGFADPDRELPVSRGIDPAHFGNRNTSTTAYVSFTPEFHFDDTEGLYIGGFFHDGRAHTLEEQAKAPFLNPLEMANPDQESVVRKVAQGDYAALFEEVYGKGAFDNVDQAYDHIADAIANFERSDFFSPFTSKYDYYLRGKAQLTEQELRGLEIFEDESKGNCAACHPSSIAEDGTLPLFTDYSYDNLGVPKLADSPFYQVDPKHNPEGAAVIDLGLGGVLNVSAENGKFKVSTLRNIAATPPYMHNGIFSTLREVVEFYNSRDTDSRWGEPEVNENVNHDELGDLGLTEQEVDDIVAFMLTLSDGYRP